MTARRAWTSTLAGGGGVAPIMRAIRGVGLLVHPFPSILDGLVVALVAMVAGGSFADALRLGLSMTLLQFSIGAVNDIVDAPRDEGWKPAKPIPGGLVPVAVARLVAAVAATLGIALAAATGPGLVALAAVVLAIGLAYDLRAKGTSLSWLPLALGIPLLPVYGWFGVAGSLPAVFGMLVPIAATEGAALAIANAVVDLERDRAAGARSIALRLGPLWSAVAVVGLQLAVAAAAVATVLSGGDAGAWLPIVAIAALVPLAGAAVGAVAAVRAGPSLRELAWEIQALGAALLAVAWLSGLGAARL
jgi:4-hydroxybenzoate polyprenyltransferase